MDKKLKTQKVKTSEESGYVAVVYFHGMGSQRRHEENSRLVDSLDTYANRTFKNYGETLGYLSRIRPRMEFSRIIKDRVETYIRVIHKTRETPNDPWDSSLYRFYEVYWAPLMVKNSKWRDILFWMFPKILQPLKTARSPWRERQRLRRAALVKIYGDPDKWPKGISEPDFIKVVKLYNMFEGPQAHRDYKKGTFAQFLEYSEKCYGKKPETLQRLKILAKFWKKQYFWEEVSNFLSLVSIGLFVCLGLVFLAGLILMGTQLFDALGFINFFDQAGLKNIAKTLTPSWGNAFTLVFGVVSVFGLGKFLTDYMGDVEQWTTYEETNEKYQQRKKVLERGFETLAHVLSDKKCNRVVVIGHSLGTSVAQDSLLKVSRYNLTVDANNPFSASYPLKKIRHFITLASPIDKIQYLFESYKSDFHRYKRVVEELRGDIGEAPFAHHQKPYIHWLNYWDAGDVISGALHSPSNRKYIRNLSVDNVHVSNFIFPDPNTSHSAYFFNRQVMGDIFDSIFFNKYNFANAKNTNALEKMKRGPGKFYRAPKFFLYLLRAFPYLILTFGGLYLFAGNHWSFLEAVFVPGIVLGIILSGFLWSKIKGARNPL